MGLTALSHSNITPTVPEETAAGTAAAPLAEIVDVLLVVLTGAALWFSVKHPPKIKNITTSTIIDFFTLSPFNLLKNYLLI